MGTFHWKTDEIVASIIKALPGSTVFVNAQEPGAYTTRAILCSVEPVDEYIRLPDHPCFFIRGYVLAEAPTIEDQDDALVQFVEITGDDQSQPGLILRSERSREVYEALERIFATGTAKILHDTSVWPELFRE